MGSDMAWERYHRREGRLDASVRQGPFWVDITIGNYDSFLCRLPATRRYSKMLYMKTRVTFRIDGDLATTLRELPNQTKFVEDALRDALGKTCPVCAGSGRLRRRDLDVTNVREGGIKRLTREEAQHLQRIFRLGQELAATRIELRRSGRHVTFAMKRDGRELLEGSLTDRHVN